MGARAEDAWRLVSVSLVAATGVSKVIVHVHMDHSCETSLGPLRQMLTRMEQRSNRRPASLNGQFQGTEHQAEA